MHESELLADVTSTPEAQVLATEQKSDPLIPDAQATDLDNVTSILDNYVAIPQGASGISEDKRERLRVRALMIFVTALVLKSIFVKTSNH